MITTVYVLMILAPTTSTGPMRHPYTAASSKEECLRGAQGNLENWGGKTPIEWKCVPYKR
jgi:hypothetical protein